MALQLGVMGFRDAARDVFYEIYPLEAGEGEEMKRVPSLHLSWFQAMARGTAMYDLTALIAFVFAGRENCPYLFEAVPDAAPRGAAAGGESGGEDGAAADAPEGRTPAPTNSRCMMVGAAAHGIACDPEVYRAGLTDLLKLAVRAARGRVGRADFDDAVRGAFSGGGHRE
jgi:hypothetical protein